LDYYHHQNIHYHYHRHYFHVQILNVVDHIWNLDLQTLPIHLVAAVAVVVVVVVVVVVLHFRIYLFVVHLNVY